jgi:hypothetical protein
MRLARGLSWGALVAVVAVALSMLRFAMINHGTIDRSARAVRHQLGWIAVGLVVALMVWTASSAFFWAATRITRAGTPAVHVVPHTGPRSP